MVLALGDGTRATREKAVDPLELLAVPAAHQDAAMTDHSNPKDASSAQERGVASWVVATGRYILALTVGPDGFGGGLHRRLLLESPGRRSLLTGTMVPVVKTGGLVVGPRRSPLVLLSLNRHALRLSYGGEYLGSAPGRTCTVICRALTPSDTRTSDGSESGVRI